MRLRTPVVALGVTGLLLALASGCSGSSSEPAADKADAAAVAWSPCDGLDAGQVGAVAGTAMTEETGSVDAPRCTFLPEATGGPAYDVSYLYFDGGLDAALTSMGGAGRQLRSVEVPGATAARIAVKTDADGILVTGFVETDGLVQSVNAAQVAPYDEQALVRSTTALLAALVAEAPDPS